jgi:drug/metabolite transporter (DMT)-like permease
LAQASAAVVRSDDKRSGATTEASLILASVFWGSNYAATKFAALSVLPLSIVALRFAVAGLLMYAVLRVLEPKSRLRREDLLPMAGLGCLGVAVGQTAFTFGLSLTTAANAGLIFATAPVWGLLLGLALGLERPTLTGTLGLGLSIAGIGIVFREGLEADGAGLAGDLSVLLAAVGFGAYTVLSMRTLGRYSPLAVATYPTLLGAPVVLVVSVPVLLGTRWEGVEAGAWAAVGFSAVFATAFAFAAWQRGVSRIGANRVLVYQYLITLTGIASGVAFFGEDLSASKIAGGAVILLGVYLARRR